MAATGTNAVSPIFLREQGSCRLAKGLANKQASHINFISQYHNSFSNNIKKPTTTLLIPKIALGQILVHSILLAGIPQGSVYLCLQATYSGTYLSACSTINMYLILISQKRLLRRRP